ncbi:MAG: P-loop NTPase [Planctomycetota bacterium]
MSTASSVPADQAASLRALVARHDERPSLRLATGEQPESASPPPKTGGPVRRAPVIAIGSGKGGVGKTMLAVNLSAALQQFGLNTSLLDADIGTANADVLCGITAKHRLEKLLQGRQDVRARDLMVPAPGGFRLLPGITGEARLAVLGKTARQAITRAAREISASSDAMLVDTGAGVRREVTTFLETSDASIIVMTPEPASLVDAYALLKCLRQRGALRSRPGVVINRATSDREAEEVFARLAKATARFLRYTPNLVGVVREDSRVRRAAQRRDPIVVSAPRSRAARDILALAERVAGVVRAREAGR